jgi:hypothetical protein
MEVSSDECSSKLLNEFLPNSHETLSTNASTQKAIREEVPLNLRANCVSTANQAIRRRPGSYGFRRGHSACGWYRKYPTAATSSRWARLQRSWRAEPRETSLRWACVDWFRYGNTSRYHATDFDHFIDTTARPRAPHPRHRTRSLRSSTLSRGLRPSRDKNAGESSAVCEQAAQSTFTKSPGPRSSIRAK